MFDVFKFSRRSSSAAAALILLAALPAAAQTATAPAAGAAPAAAASPAAPAPIPPVGQPEPPASAIAAARELVAASGMARSFSPMAPQLIDQVVPLLTRTRPELKAKLSQTLVELRPEIIAKGDGMIDVAAKIYARRMSEQELKDAAAFFESAVGKKYVEVQPLMLDELVIAMQSWTQELSNFIMTRVHDEMKKKGQDF